MRVYIDREYKRARNYIMKIVVVWAMMLLLKGSLVDASYLSLFDSDRYKMYTSSRDAEVLRRKSSTCIIKYEEIHLSNYMKMDGDFRIITNLSPNTSVNNEFIVLEESNDASPLPETIITCLYKETERDGVIVREPVPPLKEQEESAKILVISLVSERTREVYERKMQEAEKIKKDPSRRDNIKKALKTLMRLVNIGMCNDYIPIMNKCGILLKDIKEANHWFSRGWIKNIAIDNIKDMLLSSSVFNENFIYYGLIIGQNQSIDDLLKKYEQITIKVERKYDIYKTDIMRFKEILKENPKNESDIILNQIKDFEEYCNKCNTYAGRKRSLPKYAKDLIAYAKGLGLFYINTLTEEGIPLSVQEDKMLSKYISENSKEIKDRAVPWNRDLVNLLINSWIRYDKIEKEKQKEIDGIIGVCREENSKIRKELEIREGYILAYDYIPKIIDAVRKIIKIVKERPDCWDDNKWEGCTEIPKEALDNINIKICDDIVSILAGIVHNEQDSKTMQNIVISIQDRVHPLIYKILGCYTESTSIKELIKSVEKSKKEIVDILHSIAFNNQFLAIIDKNMVVLKDLLREILNVVSDRMHRRFAILINYNKSGLIGEVAKEEQSYLQPCDVKEAMQYLLEFANKFWYSPQYCSGLIASMKDAIAQENILKYIIEKFGLFELKDLLMFSYQAYKSINYIAICDEIWENPAVLHLNKGFYLFRNKISFFIYKENDTTYISKVPSNDSNIEVIKKAQTHWDITEAIGNDRQTVIEFEEMICDLRQERDLDLYLKNVARELYIF